MLFEAVEILFIPGLDEWPDGGIGFVGFKDHVPFQFRSIVHRLECHGHSKDMHWQVVDKFDAFFCEDGNEGAGIFIVFAVGSMHRELPFAARPEVESMDRVCKSFRPPPFLQM